MRPDMFSRVEQRREWDLGLDDEQLLSSLQERDSYMSTSASDWHQKYGRPGDDGVLHTKKHTSHGAYRPDRM